jgi:pSer/pThr/pTyr-binding forkhead associated (FHA) protein
VVKMKKVKLIIHSAASSREELILPGQTRIGREEADIILPDNGVSRLHARINWFDDKIWILDESSTNGTFINEVPVSGSGSILRNGDVIRVGNDTSIVIAITDIRSESPTKTVSMSPALFAIPLVGVLLITFLTILSYRSETDEKIEVVQMPATTPLPSREIVPSGTRKSKIPELIKENAVDSSPPKTYQQMSEDEKLEFIQQRAQHIGWMMGKRSYDFNLEVVKLIKSYVDAYASRANSSSTRMWGEGLMGVFRRGIVAAPLIIRSFNQEGVPPVVGLYLAMIESEYRSCVGSPVGATGMFQFMAATARHYGVDPANRCNVELMAPAAARYMRDRISEFGGDSTSVALAIAGYNRSPASVRRDLQDVLNSENRERSFWTLVANGDKLDHYFQRENIKYVPKFFAAAIVGETPWAFNLNMNQLSTYTDENGSLHDPKARNY